MRLQGLAAGLLLAGALAGPSTAAAHGTDHPGVGAGDETLRSVERHRAADQAGVPVETLERRVRAIARRLGSRDRDARARTRARAAAAAEADPGVVGRWSAVTPAPVVPVFEALLPNGKVLLWDSVGDNSTESYADHTFTRAAVYDPATNTSKRVDVAGANLFCAGYVQLANGNVFVAGGNLDRALAGIRRTHTFDWRTETWTRGPDMQDGRWYPSVAALPNDEAVIVGGGPTVAEVRTTSGGLRRLTGFTTGSSREYPFLQAATDGRALLLGPSQAMSVIDWAGIGSRTSTGNRDATGRGYGSYAPYDVGRFLVAGGGSVAEDGLSGVPTRTASVVDTRSGTPIGRATGSMTYRRRQANLTLLADGSALATGGQTTNHGKGLVDLTNAVFAAERWDPATGTWSTLAPAAKVRQYHSTALLLPDARVLTGGGGICDACTAAGYLEKNFETFTPPYLFRKDGSGQLAPRPEITQAPGDVGYDGAFTVTSPQAAQIRRVGLVRLGAPTHGMDQSQRYVPLGFTAAGTTLSLTAPANPNEAPAGHYMLFAVDAAGVPSVARIVRVGRPAVPTVARPANFALRRAATGSPSCDAGTLPSKAVNGTTSGGLSDKWCSRLATPFLQVDLGAERTLTTFVVKHAGAGGQSPSLNTRDFGIETSLDGTTWTQAVAVTGNAANVTTRTVAARTARHIRLVITAAEQVNAAGPARIFELEAYSGTSVAPPAPVVAYAGTSASGVAQRFEAGQYEAGRGNLGLVGNDAARSLDVAQGYQATLCADPDMAGACTTLGPGRYDSLPAGFDRVMSSLRVRPG